METASSNILLSSPASTPSRRGILASLTGGLLATGLVSLGEGDAEARKKGKRRKRRNNKRDNKGKNSPKTRPDATCPGPPDFALNDPGDNVRFAQTFTAVASGPLVSAELQINKREGSSGDYLLRLSPVDGDGIPTNDVLAETSVANADVPEGSPIVSFSFADPFSVKAGADYALVMTRTEGDVGWNARGRDSCAGQAFQSLQADPFRATGTNDDFVFTTFVRS